MQDKAFYIFKKHVYVCNWQFLLVAFFKYNCFKAQFGAHFYFWGRVVLVRIFMSACALSSTFCVMVAVQQASDWNLAFWDEMIWAEAPTSFQGALLALCPIMCTAFCVHCLLHMDFEVLLFSLSPCLFISLSLSLCSRPLFSPLWVAFDAFAFYEWFSLTPASPCLSFLSVKQWVFFLSNNVDKLQLVKCHFPCLLPFWASFPSCSSQRFTFNCVSNTHGVHQCGTFGVRLLWRGDGNY